MSRDKSSPKPLPTTTDINPLTNIIYGKKNRSNITNLSILTTQELSRCNTSFYLSRDLSATWRQYCRLSGKDGCWLIEEALLEYMKNHSNQNVSLSVTQDLRTYAHTRNEEIKLEIAKQELREQIEVCSRVTNLKAFLPKLRRLVKNAVELHYQDDDMGELLELARRFFK